MRKISVFLPPNSGNNTLRTAKNVAKSIVYQATQNNDDIQVIFSYAKNEYFSPIDFFEDLTKNNIVLRETIWEIHNQDSLHIVANLVGLSKTPVSHSAHCIPSDDINNFYDCDLWVVVSDNLPAPLLPLRSTLFVLDEYTHRHISNNILINNKETISAHVANKTRYLRQASRIIVTVPSLTEDLITHAGVNKSRIKFLPIGFQPAQITETTLDVSLPQNYILWLVDNIRDNNVPNVFHAYEIYLNEFDGSLDLIVLVLQDLESNSNPNGIDGNEKTQDDKIQYLQDKINRDFMLRKRIKVIERSSEISYARLIKNAKFIWNTILHGNNMHTAMDAAYLGTPTLSSRSPYSEYISENYKINLQFFDSKSYKSMAMALSNMESIYSSILLPDWPTLNNYTWQSLSHFIYQEIADIFQNGL